MMVLNAARRKDMDDKKFMAQLQGINLDDQDNTDSDLADLKGVHANQAGFGVGLGIGYSIEGE